MVIRLPGVLAAGNGVRGTQKVLRRVARYAVPSVLLVVERAVLVQLDPEVEVTERPTVMTPDNGRRRVFGVRDRERIPLEWPARQR
jgi:hypothetical protein